MDINPEKARSKVVGRIWQSFAESGVPIQALSQEQWQKLAETLADNVLLAYDELLVEHNLTATQPAAHPPLAEEEQILWEGRPLLSMSTLYQITNERIRVQTGMLATDRDDIELIRIQDIDHSQNLGERILNIGDIIIRSADPSLPEVTLHNIPDPIAVHEIIRRAMLDARKRFGYGVREEL